MELHPIDFMYLEKALSEDDVEGVKRHVTRHNVNNVNTSEVGVVSYVCSYGVDDRDELIMYFVELGISHHLLENITSYFWGTMHRAAIRSKTNIMKALINLGVPVDSNGKNKKSTPLFHALLSHMYPNTNEKKKTVIFLLDHGANPDLIEEKELLPQYARDFINHRQTTRHASIIILGLHRCYNGRKNVLQHNGKDVLSMIARCLWSLLGNKI